MYYAHRRSGEPTACSVSEGEESRVHDRLQAQGLSRIPVLDPAILDWTNPLAKLSFSGFGHRRKTRWPMRVSSPAFTPGRMTRARRVISSLLASATREEGLDGIGGRGGEERREGLVFSKLLHAGIAPRSRSLTRQRWTSRPGSHEPRAACGRRRSVVRSCELTAETGRKSVAMGTPAESALAIRASWILPR